MDNQSEILISILNTLENIENHIDSIETKVRYIYQDVEDIKNNGKV